MIWTEVEIDGSKAAFFDHAAKRLYVRQRSDRFEAWSGGVKLGNYDTIGNAKAACARSVGIPVAVQPTKFDPRKFTPAREAAPALPKCEPGEQVDVSPADIERQRALEAIATEACVTHIPPQDTEATSRGFLSIQSKYPGVIPPTIVTATIVDGDIQVESRLEGHCKCGARLGRSGKCPALCEPITDAPLYTGPRFVGSTHTGRLAAPVSW